MGNTSENKPKKSGLVLEEEKTLAFWEKNDIFKKSLEKRSPKGPFVFYDGPAFATGLPHYGHLLASIIKDVIPRYKTMQGYHVRRIWGWDCHGLPIENIIEQKLGLKQKSDIEKFGIEKFNEAARESVFTYDKEWKKIIPRLGRFVDMEGSYKTLDWTYTESIWWAFSELHKKKLIYEGYKSMHMCPRCETTLAASEVSLNYKMITDISVVAKFELISSSKESVPTYVLAWTTTPWTLPGNVALVVGPDISYVKVLVTKKEDGKKEQYILAEERLEELTNPYEVLETFDGEELVGRSYKPLFNYYSKAHLENKENGWKIYSAGFVDTNEGTGIIHIAPAFGEDDLALGRLHNLPFVQHVSMDGTFKKEVTDFKGLHVKPKDDHQRTDIEIIKYLAGKNLLFSKKKIEHSYPHCWRCDTPLLNYAASSWFVKVVALKSKLLAANKKIKWTPEHIGSGRFGKWLEGARDWAISRSRFWGAPIPVWKCEECEKVAIIGSLEDLRKKGHQANNTYHIMRHGEAVSNVKAIINSLIDESNIVTERGIKQAEKGARSLKNKKIDYIFSSPLPRTKQTAEIVASIIGINKENIIFDERLREINVGEFEGRLIEDYINFFSSPDSESRYTEKPPGGESRNDIKTRVMDFIYELEDRYKDKKILIVSHDGLLRMLNAGSQGLNKEEINNLDSDNIFIPNGEVRDLLFYPLPHNRSFEIDLHRPYIDAVTLPCSCRGIMKRVPEVFDCWFESGSMPYASVHYPFENKKDFNTNFPADFIAEGTDQTRGWFYTMLVLSVGLFGKTSYKSVIVNGMILAEDGQKMSKRLENYPSVSYIFNTYGADAVRFYLLSSPVVRAEDLDFFEKGVRETQNKIITRLRNVLSFYELYRSDEATISRTASKNVLDIWIKIRLAEVINKVSHALDAGELDKATRPIALFVDDLSTWYLRRSRDRFKGDDKEDKEMALQTTQFVLFELSKILAPFIPFVAEEVYRKVKQDTDKESVHLERWPKVTREIPVWPNPMALFGRIAGSNPNLAILTQMNEVRAVVSLALEARAKRGVKVRQPLSLLRIKDKGKKLKENTSLVALIKDEVNVKGVVFGKDISSEVELDFELTKELKQEGNLREVIRFVQELRKRENLDPSDRVTLAVKTDGRGRELLTLFSDEIKRIALIKEILFEDIRGEEVSVDSYTFVLSVRK